jgi:hypothetical protein
MRATKKAMAPRGKKSREAGDEAFEDMGAPWISVWVSSVGDNKG